MNSPSICPHPARVGRSFGGFKFEATVESPASTILIGSACSVVTRKKARRKKRIWFQRWQIANPFKAAAKLAKYSSSNRLLQSDHCLPFRMIALDALHQLPLKEKLFVMEALWDDLSQAGNALPVPQWHRETCSMNGSLRSRKAQPNSSTGRSLNRKSFRR